MDTAVLKYLFIPWWNLFDCFTFDAAVGSVMLVVFLDVTPNPVLIEVSEVITLMMDAVTSRETVIFTNDFFLCHVSCHGNETCIYVSCCRIFFILLCLTNAPHFWNPAFYVVGVWLTSELRMTDNIVVCFMHSNLRVLTIEYPGRTVNISARPVLVNAEY